MIMNISNIKLPKFFSASKPINANVPVVNQFNWFDRDENDINDTTEGSRITYMSGIDINAPLPTDQNFK
jgi:hypothetical protein